MNETSSTHRQAWDLIPWIINGRASETERFAVDSHLLSCADCREEFEFQRRLQAAMAADDAPPCDAQASWERLRARLDVAPPRASVRFGHVRARGVHRAWVPWMVAAMIVEAVGLGALGAALWSRPARDSATAGAVYRTLSAPEMLAQPGVIRVVLSPAMTLEQLHALLATAQLQVVAGPSDAGVWSLAPAGDANRAATEAALHELRASPAVRFAEPAGASP